MLGLWNGCLLRPGAGGILHLFTAAFESLKYNHWRLLLAEVLAAAQRGEDSGILP